jgi:hypothetical protein
MPSALVIRDGTPDWWESPDIWVVPGTDPDGPVGTPVAGQTAYLWAHVANTGDSDAQGVQIDFWVADPALQIRKSTANHIGTAFADIPAGAGQDVLCLVAWSVSLVNGGHECVVVEASVADDPLTPPPADPDVLDAATYPQIGQHNLSIAVAGAMQHIVVGVHAGPRAGKAARVEAQVGGKIDAAALARLGLRNYKPARPGLVRVGLSHNSLCGRGVDAGHQALDVKAEIGQSVPVFTAIEAADGLPHDEYELVKLTERVGDRVIGGISFVVLPETRLRGGRS